MLISTKEVAALERLFTPSTPDTWRDIAVTLFATMKEKVSAVAMSNDDMAGLALALTHGIADNFGGQNLYIPRGVKAIAEEKHQRIIAMRDSGKTCAEVARAMKTTEQTVRNAEAAYRKKLRTTQKQ